MDGQTNGCQRKERCVLERMSRQKIEGGVDE